MKWVKDKRPGLPDGMRSMRPATCGRPVRAAVWVFASDGAVLGNIDTGTNTAKRLLRRRRLDAVHRGQSRYLPGEDEHEGKGF